MATTEAVKKMGKKSSVFDELVKASGIVPDGGEEFAAYAERLCEKVSGMEDADFGKLSQLARTWFDKAVDAINETKPHEIPVLVGSPFANGAEVKPEAAKKVVEKKAAAPAKPEKEAKTEKAKPAEKESKPAKAPKEAKPAATAKDLSPRAEGVAPTVRLMVVQNPEITFEEVCAQIGAEPRQGSHAWNIWSEAAKVMKLVAANAAA